MKKYFLSLIILALGAAPMTNASAASIFNGGQGPVMVNTVSMAAASASSSNLNSPPIAQAMNAFDPNTSVAPANAIPVSGSVSNGGQQPALANTNSALASPPPAQ